MSYPNGMTPERLAGIKTRSDVARQAAASGTVGTPPNVDGLTVSEALDLFAESAEDVPDLLAEVNRLRAENDNLRAGAKSFMRQIDRLASGIEDIEAKADDYGQQTLANMANALLNPTEGEK